MTCPSAIDPKKKAKESAEDIKEEELDSSHAEFFGETSSCYTDKDVLSVSWW
jgi:hypothetical protein